jgi:hypothetical protein
MIENICQWLSILLPSFTITKGVLKYLTRYYFFLKDRRFANIFLHHFHRSDMDMGADGYGLLHCHPFGGFSFILTGGYREERRQADGTISVKIVKPFTFNRIRKDTFHRVDLLDETKGSWTLFFTGSRSEESDWYFWDRVLNKTIFWREVDGAIE